MEALSGLMPDAMYRAADFLVASNRSLGSCGSVMACKSTTQKKVSAAQALPIRTCIHIASLEALRPHPLVPAISKNKKPSAIAVYEGPKHMKGPSERCKRSQALNSAMLLFCWFPHGWPQQL